MAIYASKLTNYDDIYKAIKADVEFTHSHLIVHEACFLYSSAIIYLINHPND